MSELNWSEQQNNMVRDLIAEEIERARLSHKFIPEFQVEDSARSVRADTFDATKNAVDDVSTIAIGEPAEPINLSKQQAEDGDLAAALLMIRRAANKLAREHDKVVFQAILTNATLPPVYVQPDPEQDEVHGEKLIACVARALVTLENAGYVGPYVLVLGQDLFTDANTPCTGSLVLPKDRLEALLAGGPVHRSSTLPKGEGLLLSLGGDPMDRAIGVAPRFEFLRIGASDVRECRVYERFAFRFKEPESAIKLVRK